MTDEAVGEFVRAGLKEKPIEEVVENLIEEAYKKWSEYYSDDITIEIICIEGSEG